MSEPIVIAGQVRYPINNNKASAKPDGGQSGVAFISGNASQIPILAEAKYRKAMSTIFKSLLVTNFLIDSIGECN